VNREARRFLLYFLPLAINLLLALYLGWQIWKIAPIARDSRVFMFSLLYGLGGIVVAISGVTAFLHMNQQLKDDRVYYGMALVNIILPTLLLLILLYKT